MEQKSLNLAARAGRWSATHWKTATAIWIVVVLVAVVAGSMAGTHKLSMAEQSTGETARAEKREVPMCSKEPGRSYSVYRSECWAKAAAHVSEQK